MTDDMEINEDWKPEFPILQSENENTITDSYSNYIISPDSIKIKSEVSEIHSDNIIPHVEVKMEAPEEITDAFDTIMDAHTFKIDPLKVENDASEEISGNNNENIFDDYQKQLC